MRDLKYPVEDIQYEEENEDKDTAAWTRIFFFAFIYFQYDKFFFLST